MRSWRRGTREMDLILGPYADDALDSLAAGQLDQYEALLQENDQDLYLWVSGQTPCPDRHDAAVGRIQAFSDIA